jgi:hypothetical protein
MRATRKRIRILILAAIVAAVVVPVGFALSLESRRQPAAPGLALPVPFESRATAAIAPGSRSVVIESALSSKSSAEEETDVPDALKLFGLGTLLIGLSSAVRRAV